MPLEPGTSLGSYDIVALIGKGGMGEVYRATDTKLKREVAIKVLPEEFAQDSERMKRFEREAQLLASLNHPNIAAIHGLDRIRDTTFLVLELELERALAKTRELAQRQLDLFFQRRIVHTLGPGVGNEAKVLERGPGIGALHQAHLEHDSAGAKRAFHPKVAALLREGGYLEHIQKG